MMIAKLGKYRNYGFHLKTRVGLKCFVIGLLWVTFLACNLPQTRLKLISLTVFIALTPFTIFNLTLVQVSRKKLIN